MWTAGFGSQANLSYAHTCAPVTWLAGRAGRVLCEALLGVTPSHALEK